MKQEIEERERVNVRGYHSIAVSWKGYKMERDFAALPFLPHMLNLSMYDVYMQQ